jgi:ketosteroid isomerase-like protein
MKRFIPSIVITIALLPFASGNAQQKPTDTKSEQEVRQMIEKYRTALVQHDIATLEKIWADDYVFVNASGEVMTKAQRLESLKSSATSFESINEEENLTVRVYQNSAVATGRVTIKGQYSGQTASGQYRSTHVWVSGPSGWQLVANQLTALASK